AGGLVSVGVVREGPDLLSPAPTPLEQARDVAGEVLGFARPTLFTRLADHLIADHQHRLKERVKALNWELFDRAVGTATWTALVELTKLGKDRKLVEREATPEELPALRAALDRPFAEELLLWKKTKNDLVEEMSTALHIP